MADRLGAYTLFVAGRPVIFVTDVMAARLTEAGLLGAVLDIEVSDRVLGRRTEAEHQAAVDAVLGPLLTGTRAPIASTDHPMLAAARTYSRLTGVAVFLTGDREMYPGRVLAGRDWIEVAPDGSLHAGTSPDRTGAWTVLGSSDRVDDAAVERMAQNLPGFDRLHEANGLQIAGHYRATMNLTPPLLRALMHYTDNGHVSINEALRAGRGSGWATDLDQIVALYQLPAPIVVERGIHKGTRFPRGPFAPGSVVTPDRAFMSTTYRPVDWPARIVVRIVLPRGMNVISVDGAGGGTQGVGVESEILLPRNTRLVIGSDTLVDGQRRIEAVALPPTPRDDRRGWSRTAGAAVIVAAAATVPAVFGGAEPAAAADGTAAATASGDGWAALWNAVSTAPWAAVALVGVVAAAVVVAGMLRARGPPQRTGAVVSAVARVVTRAAVVVAAVAAAVLIAGPAVAGSRAAGPPTVAAVPDVAATTVIAGVLVGTGAALLLGAVALWLRPALARAGRFAAAIPTRLLGQYRGHPLRSGAALLRHLGRTARGGVLLADQARALQATQALVEDALSDIHRGWIRWMHDRAPRGGPDAAQVIADAVGVTRDAVVDIAGIRLSAKVPPGRKASDRFTSPAEFARAATQLGRVIARDIPTDVRDAVPAAAAVDTARAALDADLHRVLAAAARAGVAGRWAAGALRRAATARGPVAGTVRLGRSVWTALGGSRPMAARRPVAALATTVTVSATGVALTAGTPLVALGIAAAGAALTAAIVGPRLLRWARHPRAPSSLRWIGPAAVVVLPAAVGALVGADPAAAAAWLDAALSLAQAYVQRFSFPANRVINGAVLGYLSHRFVIRRQTANQDGGHERSPRRDALVSAVLAGAATAGSALLFPAPVVTAVGAVTAGVLMVATAGVLVGWDMLRHRAVRWSRVASWAAGSSVFGVLLGGGEARAVGILAVAAVVAALVQRKSTNRTHLVLALYGGVAAVPVAAVVAALKTTVPATSLGEFVVDLLAVAVIAMIGAQLGDKLVELFGRAGRTDVAREKRVAGNRKQRVGHVGRALDFFSIGPVDWRVQAHKIDPPLAAVFAYLVGRTMSGPWWLVLGEAVAAFTLLVALNRWRDRIEHAHGAYGANSRRVIRQWTRWTRWPGRGNRRVAAAAAAFVDAAAGIDPRLRQPLPPDGPERDALVSQFAAAMAAALRQVVVDALAPPLDVGGGTAVDVAQEADRAAAKARAKHHGVAVAHVVALLAADATGAGRGAAAAARLKKAGQARAAADVDTAAPGARSVARGPADRRRARHRARTGCAGAGEEAQRAAQGTPGGAPRAGRHDVVERGGPGRRN